MVESKLRSCRKRTLVVTRTPPMRTRVDTAVVATPLDMIRTLQEDREQIATVVLMGSFAANGELASFLVEAYPSLRVLAGRSGEEPDTYLPLYS